MKKRFKVPRKKARKMFTKTAQKTHGKNTVRVMRGGFRL